ncbi:LacI family DNA-binding transcriptional regulator [Paenibacillus harenae]|uniref:LacI family DNA-binding transcriptional regulator n=1 Tax=Paenibacillus harenae TaxID=306543 RepID=UPI00041D37E9|nr:LacI family DNA-binding transcriptional regulator [Paenibacillus harenae]
MKVSIKEVAKMAGCSTATVSNVINNRNKFVSESVRKKVLEAMETLNYKPNNFAQTLRKGKSNIVGFVVPDLTNYFFTELASAIQSVLSENGHQLIVMNSEYSLEKEKQYIRQSVDQYACGMIIASLAEKYSHLEDCFPDDFPAVFIDRNPLGCKKDCIAINNFQAAYEATQTLISKGHQRIGLINGTYNISTSKERLSGYVAALEEAEIAVDDRLIKHRSKDRTGHEGQRLIEELLEAGITAVFIVNNQMTIRVMQYLIDHQIEIPGQIAVIGFDDYEWSSITKPSLSVIRQPTYEMGVKAAEILLKRINSPSADFQEHYMLPSKLIQRSSI